MRIHENVHRELPDWWIGVNCLDLAPSEVFHKISPEVSGVWVDNAMVDERVAEQPMAAAILESRIQSGWPGLYFGGVAFKYQRQVQDLAGAAQMAKQYMDILTTSGPGTGQAAPREKIKAIRDALGDFPLAIASGITPDNVQDYLDVADCFLVATGISSSFTELDPSLVRALVVAVRVPS